MRGLKGETILAVFMLIMVYAVACQGGKMVSGISVQAGKAKPVVVIDEVGS